MGGALEEELDFAAAESFEVIGPAAPAMTAALVNRFRRLRPARFFRQSGRFVQGDLLPWIKRAYLTDPFISAPVARGVRMRWLRLPPQPGSSVPFAVGFHRA